MNYKDPIRAFMQRLGRGKCIVVVLSKAYLTSASCMFELTEIAERETSATVCFPSSWTMSTSISPRHGSSISNTGKTRSQLWTPV